MPGKTKSGKKSSVKVADLRAKDDPKGGGKPKATSTTEGSLDAGVHFKYDVKS